MKKLLSCIMAMIILFGCSSKLPAEVKTFNNAINKTFNEERWEISYELAVRLSGLAELSSMEATTIDGTIAYDKNTNEASGSLIVDKYQINWYTDAIKVVVEYNDGIETKVYSSVIETNHDDIIDTTEELPADVKAAIESIQKDLAALKLIESATFTKNETTILSKDKDVAVTELTASLSDKKMKELIVTLTDSVFALASLNTEASVSSGVDMDIAKFAIKSYLALATFDQTETVLYIDNDGYALQQAFLLKLSFQEASINTYWGWSVIDFGDDVKITPIDDANAIPSTDETSNTVTI